MLKSVNQLTQASVLKSVNQPAAQILKRSSLSASRGHASRQTPTPHAPTRSSIPQIPRPRLPVPGSPRRRNRDPASRLPGSSPRASRLLPGSPPPASCRAPRLPPPGHRLGRRLLRLGAAAPRRPPTRLQLRLGAAAAPSSASAAARPGSRASGSTTDDAPPDMSKMELKKILDKIENIINEAHKILQLLNLPSHSNVDKRQTVAANPRGAVTTASPPTVVIGRDEDRNEIIAMLHETVGDGQPESNSALSYSIIGIHGIPGSGKSTLAQYVCAREKNNKREKKEGHFDLVMWIHVSQNYSVDTIFREMLEEATGNPSPEFKSLNILEQKVEEALHGKRFLLVLDDVWYNKDVSHQIQQVISPLKVGKAGSKILVTSRTSDALLALGAVRCIPISDLDDDFFLKLFMHYALEGARIDDQNRTTFETIGEGIAKKLKRSPLAARTVGGQLRIRPDVEFWRSVLDRDLLNETMGALWWSYHHLDEQVRRCLAYCSVFPRRYLLKRDELVNLWVAEGFIRTTNTGEEMEAVGRGYLDELVSTSFLQLAGGRQDCYTIHDLLRDLVEKVARSDCFRIESGLPFIVESGRPLDRRSSSRCSPSFY